METGPRFKVSSDRLVKLGIEPASPGLQGKWLIHYTTAAPKMACKAATEVDFAQDKCTHLYAAIENTLHNRRTWAKNARNSAFDFHLSPVGRQIAIENSVSCDFYLRSLIVLTFSIATYPVWYT